MNLWPKLERIEPQGSTVGHGRITYKITEVPASGPRLLQSWFLFGFGRSRKGVDQIDRVGATPAGNEIEASYGRKLAVAAADDVVKVSAVGGTNADFVDGWVEEAEGFLAIGHHLLICQLDQAGPLRSGIAGAAVTSGASAVVAAVLIRVGFGGDVRDIAQGLRGVIERGDDAFLRLIVGNRNFVLG